MTTAFETLYDLAISIRINPTHHKITKNHTLNRDLAENQLRRSILSLVMPGENINSRWEKLRIFCKNLANRDHSPLSFQEVSGLLSKVECLHSDESSRVLSIVDIANETFTSERSAIFKDAVKKLTSRELLPELGGISYFDWVDQRWLYWINKSMEEVIFEELIHDIDILCSNKKTKIPGMGLALATNFFADMGVMVFGKPDRHVTPIMNLLTLRSGELEALKALVSVARIENKILLHNPKFSWLDGYGGVTTRYLDRLIYLIGSDNFNLDGQKDNLHVPQRRELIRSAFIENNLISSRYSQ